MDLNFRTIYNIAVIFLISLSCETPIDIEDINYKPQAVFLCQLNPDEEIRVELNQDISVLNSADYFQRIEGANISLFEDDKLIAELEGIPGYYNLAYRPKQNSTYKFQVNHPKYPQLIVADKIPLKKSKLEVNSISQTYESRINAQLTGPIKSYVGNISFVIELSDKSIENNFYELGFFSYYNFYSDRSVTEDSVYNSGDLFLANAQPNIFEDNINKWLVTDEFFINSSIDIKMNGELRLQASVVENLVSHGIRIRFRQVSQAYYQYYLTAELQKYLSGDPFAEPVQVFSNVEGGGGFLGSYVEEIIDVPLENP